MLRNTAREILQLEDSLSEIVQLVGKESLSEDQKVVMEVAKIIREDFLQQNAFTDYDYTCPLVKSIGMLRTIITFYNCCQRTILDSPPDAKVSNQGSKEGRKEGRKEGSTEGSLRVHTRLPCLALPYGGTLFFSSHPSQSVSQSVT